MMAKSLAIAVDTLRRGTELAIYVAEEHADALVNTLRVVKASAPES